VGGTGSTAMTDRTPFVGPKTPDEVAKMVSILNSNLFDKAAFRTVVTGVVLALEGKDVDRSTFDALIRPDTGVSEQMVLTVVAGLHRLLQLALRLPDSKLKPEVVKEDLQQLKFPEAFIQDITSVLFGPRHLSMQNNAVNLRPHLPTLDTFQWRVDVSISTSVLSRVVEPNIMMQMSLSDNSSHYFETSVAKFHELRYGVTCLLKEMENLEKRTILKIQD